jgi:ribosomal protein S18 acetylase RimI-like enzyme
MSDFTFRDAQLSDIPFLVNTIIEAEKSGTDILTYNTIFGITEAETRQYLADIFAQEVDGCELSLSSFLLAEADSKVVAAVAAWIEGSEGIPSAILKGNLLKFSLPKEVFERAIALNSMINELHIEYIPNTIQIGVVYVEKDFRGQKLADLLISKQIEKLLQRSTKPAGVYVQVFGNNISAIKAYSRANFIEILIKESKHERIMDYMPYKSKILMRRDL